MLEKESLMNLIPAEIVQDSAQRSGGLVTDFLRMLGVSCLKAKRDKLKTVNINASNELLMS